MNELGLNLLWLAGQVTLLCLVALAVLTFAGRRTLANLTTSWLAIVLILGLTLMSLSPWPRWSWETAVTDIKSSKSVSDNASQIVASEHDFIDVSTTPSAIGSELESPWSAALGGFVSSFGRVENSVAATPIPASLTWSGWLAYLAVVALIVGLGRFVLGWLVVGNTIRRSKTITDSSTNQLLDILQAELSCRKAIRLCESGEVAAPATTGWWQPVILLPQDWRSWKAHELRTVLAHEIAHVINGDAGKWLVAQISLLLNFYHPLVHMLVHRLRLEQELAADALAAGAVGGSHPYLTTLAELAAHQPSRTQAWPAQAFFPASGTLLRRIEMLRDQSARTRCNKWRVPCVTALLLAATVVVGLRRPVVAAEPSTATPVNTPAAIADAPAAETSYPTNLIPSNAALVVGIQPARLAALPELKSVRTFVQNQFEESNIAIRLEDLQSVMLVSTGGAGNANSPEMTPPVTILQLSSKADQAAVTSAYSSFGTVVTPNTIPEGYADVVVPMGDRLLMIGRASAIRSALKNSASGRPTWVDSFGVTEGHMHVGFDPSFLRPVLQEQMAQGPNPFAIMMAPLWQEPALVTGRIAMAESMDVELKAITTSAAGAQKVKIALQGAMPVAQAMLSGLRGRVAQQSPTSDNATADKAMVNAIDMATAFIQQSTIQVDENTVTLNQSGDSQTVAKLASMLIPAVKSARTAARRTQSMNNMKQLMLALHNYHDAYGHFPPQYLLGPDGKTKHSWRVAILPFLSQNELYEQYKFDEPWDSDANRRVLEQMPPVYANPAWTPGETRTAYFGLVGQMTALGQGPGPNNAGVRLSDFTDGTSNTVMLVEADRQIPWTRPEDLPYDENTDPEIGMPGRSGFLFAFGDGSVRTIPKSLDPKELRKLFLRNDGEIISYEQN